MQITNIIQKIALEIDNINTQINNAMEELENNKKMAVSEIFETNHEQDAINIASYRDIDTKLKLKINILQQTLDEQKNLAIQKITEAN